MAGMNFFGQTTPIAPDQAVPPAQQTSLYTSNNAALATGVISAVGGMVSGYYASRLGRIQAKWEARIAEENQRRAELAAQDALNQSAFNIGQISMKAQQIKSSAKASMGASGVDVKSRSFVEAQVTTDIMKEESIAIERLNGLRAAWGFRDQALTYGAQAGAARVTARSFSPAGGAIAGFASGAMKGVEYYSDFRYMEKLKKIRGYI